MLDAQSMPMLEAVVEAAFKTESYLNERGEIEKQWRSVISLLKEKSTDTDAALFTVNK